MQELTINLPNNPRLRGMSHQHHWPSAQLRACVRQNHVLEAGRLQAVNLEVAKGTKQAVAATHVLALGTVTYLS